MLGLRLAIATIVSLASLQLAACGGSASSSGNTTTSHADTDTDTASSSADDTGEESDAASGGDTGEGEESEEFKLNDSDTAKEAHGAHPSKIKATDTHAAVKLFVVDKAKEAPIEGIVISLQDPSGKKYYTEETDSAGYAEVLVPKGQKYELIYLTLGKKDITAKVAIPDQPRQNIKLTLRYKPRPMPVPKVAPKAPSGFRLDGINFGSNSADLLPESKEQLDGVVEYMTHKKSVRIEIAGHTDNVGKPKVNKTLSLKRAQACRKYLIEQGIDGSRIEAVGHGDEIPVGDNSTEEGRRENRRIEAREL